MSTHCSKYPNCGCPKEYGTKCYSTNHKSISDCLADAGFSCKTIPISEHSKLEAGIRTFAYQFKPPVNKITVAMMRDLESQVSREEISYSRMVELLNEFVSA